MSEPEIVVVAGAASEVGRAVARRFAADGAKVALLAASRDGLKAAAAEVEGLGGTALPLQTDVADADAVEAAAAATEEAFGEIDVWINDAFATASASFTELDPSEFRRATEITYLGTVWGTLAALEHMAPRDRGVVVTVVSAAASRPLPRRTAACGSTRAVEGFVESLRAELAETGSNVRLAMVRLPLDPPQPDAAADAVNRAAHMPPAPLDGSWRVERTGGLLPPMVGVTKHVRGDRGVTRIGRVAGIPFVVVGNELRYAAPFGAFVDRVEPDAHGFAGTATFRGRAFGRFVLRRLNAAGRAGPPGRASR